MCEGIILPIILPLPSETAPPDFATWLDAARPPAEVERLFAPSPAASLTATPVRGGVNDGRHEGGALHGRAEGACGPSAGLPM